MACFYEMLELKIPFNTEVLFDAKTKDLRKARKPITIQSPSADKKRIVLQPGTVKCKGELTPLSLYTLRVCKDCRADWLEAIKNWFEHKLERKSPGTGIFVRRNGENVELTEKEWTEQNPGREPYRVKKEKKAS